MRQLITGLALLVAVAACTPAGGESPSAGPATVTVTVTASPGAPASTQVSAPPSGATVQPTPKPADKPAAFGPRPVVAPDGRTCPDHPTPACTGAPPGLKLQKMPLNDGNAYRVTVPGSTLDGVYVPGDLVIPVSDVVIKNSVIDGTIFAYKDNVQQPYTIMDSTVGPAEGCNSLPGVGEGHYTAARVYIRNHGDGFRDSGDDIVVMDSFVDLCSNPGDHSDGIQGYGAGRNLFFDHNTIDQRGVADRTAPIFFPAKQSPKAANITITNNLVIGGTYSIQLREIAGSLIARNNMMVDKTWDYLPVDADCGKADWKDNQIVEIDQAYRITKIVGPLQCTG
ncbi:hypothetical protein ABZ297_37260 [Nonomuraea sp. NPDC005983]|uniref:hypothetical protein n=1 Tax=Nonomuraea sp. NPDC005983 TaxID=3155595 RepID=UPI0033AF0A2D